jgi:hypothetical protein
LAHLPEGAYPLDNPIGAAPGVVLDLESSTIICLPGVPAELKGIVEGPLQPLLRRLFGERVFIERLVIVNCTDESILAPALRTVAERHPDVYVKSRAHTLTVFADFVKRHVPFMRRSRADRRRASEKPRTSRRAVCGILAAIQRGRTKRQNAVGSSDEVPCRGRRDMEIEHPVSPSTRSLTIIRSEACGPEWLNLPSS